MNGKLIVIEGLDGCGKTTQWELLRTKFPKASFVTFPDYDSHAGRLIRDYLSGDFGEYAENAYAVSSFYAVDRFVSFVSFAKSWGQSYASGADIICARYTSSNAIYQMAKLPQEQWEGYLRWLYEFEHERLKLPRPDLTVFLSLPLDVSDRLLQTREAHGGDIHERDAVYREKCRQAAIYLAEREGWTKLNCADSFGEMRAIGDIHNELTGIITNATL